MVGGIRGSAMPNLMLLRLQLRLLMLTIVALVVIATGDAFMVKTPHGFAYSNVSPDGSEIKQGYYEQMSGGSVNGVPFGDFVPPSEDSSEVYDKDEQSVTAPLEIRNIVSNANNGLVTGQLEQWPQAGVQQHVGEISGVSICPKSGAVFVFHRADRLWTLESFDFNNKFVNSTQYGPIKKPTIAIIENGTITKEFGSNQFYMPHGITLDYEGNIWITDVALHQVFKFAKGRFDKPVMILGEKLIPGSDNSHFCKPTHVVVAKNGDFFVADGYCNSRIMKFSKDGKILKIWGKKGTSLMFPGINDLQVPHQLALIESRDTVCVADRENRRVVCYNAGLRNKVSANKTGEYLFQLDLGEMGPIYGIAYSPQLDILLVLGGISTDVDASAVFTYNLETQQPSSTIRYNDVQGFGYAHALATCPSSKHSPLPGVQACLVVAGLASHCSASGECSPVSIEEVQQGRRLWLYSLDKQSNSFLSPELTQDGEDNEDAEAIAESDNDMRLRAAFLASQLENEQLLNA